MVLVEQLGAVLAQNGLQDGLPSRVERYVGRQVVHLRTGGWFRKGMVSREVALGLSLAAGNSRHAV